MAYANEDLKLVHTRMLQEEIDGLTLLARNVRLSRTQLIAQLLLGYLTANAELLVKLRDKEEARNAAS